MAEFWTSRRLEPKRSHRWLLYVGTVAGTIPSYIVKKVNKPSFSVNESAHSYFGHQFYYPGILTWSDVSFTLVDPVDPDASKMLQSVIEVSGYKTPDRQDPAGSGVLHTIAKANAVGALGSQIILEQRGLLGDDPNAILETWTMVNPWVKSVSFGNLDYASDAMVDVDVTVRYDYAVLV